MVQRGAGLPDSGESDRWVSDGGHGIAAGKDTNGRNSERFKGRGQLSIGSKRRDPNEVLGAPWLLDPSQRFQAGSCSGVRLPRG